MQLGWATRRSAYFDSIALMRVAEQVRQGPGVHEIALVMGTPGNRAMLVDAGMWPADAPATDASDLLMAVQGASEEAVRLALERVAQLLDASRTSATATSGERMAPRTIASAARAGGANLALIALPGPFAALDAHQALSAGLHVFLFSDGVVIEEEIALKRRARARGLLVMGPECGTSIVDGVGLGFANRVRRGAVGVVGAAGTGVQELTSLVHRLGAGVSHAIGTGGRDLHAAVGGVTTLQGLELLADDRDTGGIIIVSKPSSPAVAGAVLTAAANTGKPVIACLLGHDSAMPAGVKAAATLEEAAIAAVRLAGRSASAFAAPEDPAASFPAGAVRGLFSGGTLCEEARRIVGEGPHRFVDFGAEEYTRGRPHPIVDPGRRHAAILEAACEPEVTVLLLDVVIGDGAHPDPAGALLPVLGEARERARRAGRDLAVVAHVVGTEEDPQDLVRQEKTLREASAIVCASNRVAAATARRLAEGRRAD